MKTRTFQVTLLALILFTACNKEDFYGVKLEVQGADALCVAGTDIQSCEAIAGCQAALEESTGCFSAGSERTCGRRKGPDNSGGLCR